MTARTRLVWAPHFTNASIDVDTVLGLANLSHSKLKYATFSLFVCNLLASDSESTLGLNGGLLDLH
jgi:hypothetical protein